MKDAKLFGKRSCPSEEYIINNTKRRLTFLFIRDVNNEFFESRLKRSGGMDKLNDKRVRNNVCVFDVRRETVIKTIERDFKKTN